MVYIYFSLFSSRDSIPLLLAGGTPRRTTERLSSSLSWSVTRAWAGSPPTLCPSSRAGPSSTTWPASYPPPSTSRASSVLLILGYQCLGLLDPDPGPLVRCMDPDPSIILLSSSKNSKKNLDSYCFVTSFGHFVFEK
jgi:hypothetical protein